MTSEKLKVSLDCFFVRGQAGRVTQSTLRISQEERTRAMRARLLDATVELLVERGYAGTTTTLVSERAGVSRGAQLHHFPSKNDLVVAAVAHVMSGRAAALEAAVAEHRGAPVRAILEMLADYCTSAGFKAALELWVAARTDPDLLAEVAPLERQIGREAHRLTVELLGADESRAGVRELVQATLDLCRGLGLADTLSDDRRRRTRILDQWADVLEKELA
jgi:AcrR family transcriptional regulator